MASSTHIETAKIYQFPVGGRRGAVTASSAEQSLNALELAAASRIAAASGWYHDAAMEADKTPYKS